jgi:hypothetical protein
MSPLRARVEKGPLALDEATTLPDGTVVDLVAGSNRVRNAHVQHSNPRIESMVTVTKA